MSFVKSDSVPSIFENYDLIIIGGGLSGLTAAHTILKKDSSLRIIILESKERIGGQLLSVPLKGMNGKKSLYELGAQTFHESHEHLRHLLAELDLKVRPHFSQGSSINHSDAKTFNRHEGVRLVHGVFAYVDLLYFIYKIEKMSKYLTNHLYLDGVDMAQFLRKELWTKSAIKAVSNFITATYGIGPMHLSALYFLIMVRSTSSFEDMLFNRMLELEGGTYALINELNKRTNCTITDECVLRITTIKDKVYVTTNSLRVFRADYIIVAIPPSEILKISFEPEIPYRTALMEGHIQGHMSKFVFTYSEAFWRQEGDSGVVYGPGDPTTCCQSGHIDLIFEATSSTGSPALAGIYGGWHSVFTSSTSKKERKENRLQQLAAYWGKAALDYNDYAETTWTCTSGGFRPGFMHLFYTIAVPSDRVLWAGSEVSTRWPGFMTGAVQSGERAAFEALWRLRPQTLTAEDIERVCSGVTRKRSQLIDTLENINMGVKGAVALGVCYFFFRSWRGW